MDIKLKAISPVHSTDKEWVRLQIEGFDGEDVNIDMKSDDFIRVLGNLIEFSLQFDVSKALPDNDPAISTPSMDHALLLAKNIDLVVSENGDCVIQLQTTHDAAFQIALTDKMTHFLKSALNTQFEGKAS